MRENRLIYKLCDELKLRVAASLRLACILAMVFVVFTGSCKAYDYYEAGKGSYRQGNYEIACRYFIKVLQDDPGHTKCRYYYATSLLKLKMFKSAQKEYETIIEIAPQSPEAMLATNGISQINKYLLVKKGKYYDTVADKKSGQKKYTLKSAGDNYIANSLENGQVTRWNSRKMPVKVYVEKSVNVPGYKDFYYTEAVKALDNWTKSIDGNLLSYTLVTDPTQANIQLYFVEEVVKTTGKEFVAGLATPHVNQHVLQYYDVKLASHRPDGRTFTQKEIYMTILHELGHSFGIRGHSAKEADIMYAAKDTNPKNITTGLSERDINTMTLLYTLDPDISNFNKGETAPSTSEKNEKILGSKEHRLQEKLKEALEYTQKFPDNMLSWAQLGKAYYSLKQYDDAIQALNKSLKIEPQYTFAIETLAFVYKDMGDFANSSKYFQKLIEVEPENVSFAHNYMLYLCENKQHVSAKTVLQDLLVKNPKAIERTEIQKMKEYLRQF